MRSNKAIRDVVHDRVADALPDLRIFTTRFTDHEDDYVAIYMGVGEVVQENLSEAESLELNVSVNLASPLESDDQLDALGVRALNAIFERDPSEPPDKAGDITDLNGLVAGMVQSGFEYGETDGRRHRSLVLRFQISIIH